MIEDHITISERPEQRFNPVSGEWENWLIVNAHLEFNSRGHVTPEALKRKDEIPEFLVVFERRLKQSIIKEVMRIAIEYLESRPDVKGIVPEIHSTKTLTICPPSEFGKLIKEVIE